MSQLTDLRKRFPSIAWEKVFNRYLNELVLFYGIFMFFQLENRMGYNNEVGRNLELQVEEEN